MDHYRNITFLFLSSGSSSPDCLNAEMKYDKPSPLVSIRLLGGFQKLITVCPVLAPRLRRFCVGRKMDLGVYIKMWPAYVGHQMSANPVQIVYL